MTIGHSSKQHYETGAPKLTVADYYRQRGVSPNELSHMTSTVMGTFIHEEAAARGIQSGFRFLSIFVAAAGLLVTAMLIKSDVERRVQQTSG